MNPSKEEIEKSVGESIPDDAPIVEVSSLPDPEKSEGLLFRLAGMIEKKWKVFFGVQVWESRLCLLITDFIGSGYSEADSSSYLLV